MDTKSKLDDVDVPKRAGRVALLPSQSLLASLFHSPDNIASKMVMHLSTQQVHDSSENACLIIGQNWWAVFSERYVINYYRTASTQALSLPCRCWRQLT